MYLKQAEDRNPAANIVEVELVARRAPIRIGDFPETERRTYNGSLPGPLIRAKRGDRLIVQLENQLEHGTTIHWHGVRLANGMDGVPGITQEIVEAGAGFRYEFELPDAGLFWYHPHFRTLEAITDGLYGALLVDDPDEPEGLGDETVLVLSDVDLNLDGSAYEPTEDASALLLGREGPLALVNGRLQPSLHIPHTGRQRLRLLNACRSRYFQLELPGSKFLLIGSDGGKTQSTVELDELRLVPGERVDVLVDFDGAPGEELQLRTLPLERGPGAPSHSEPIPLMTFLLTAETGVTDELPELGRDIDRFPTEAAEHVNIALTMIVEGEEAKMGINGIPYADSEPVTASIGTPQIWHVQNLTAYSHPFHMHGFYFEALDDSGALRTPRQLKDTIEIPTASTVSLVPRFDPRPGLWMFHCHILDHAENGMMGKIDLKEP